MKKLIATVAYIALTAAALTAQILDRPVAVVRLTETVNIGQRELRAQVTLLERQLGRTLTAAERGEVLGAQIDEVLLTQAARRAGIRVTTQEVQQAIAAQRQSIGRQVTDAQFRQIVQDETGLGWDAYVDQITKRLTQERFIMERSRDRLQNVSPPTAAEIEAVYEANAAQFTNPAMVRFDHLFFDTRGKNETERGQIRSRADALAQQLRSGTKTYDQLLRESLDDATFAGGDFGYLVRGDQQASARLGTGFVDGVFAMRAQEISGVLNSNLGFHIVRITDRRAPRLLGLDDPLLPGESVTVRAQIRAALINQKQQVVFQQSVESVLEQLRREAEVRRFPENLNW